MLISLFLESSAAQTSLLAPVAEDKAALCWVDSVMQTLDRRARVAQLFMPVVSSQPGNGWPEKIDNWVSEQGIGGLFFDRGSLEQQAFATSKAQAKAKVPLMVAADAEWGLAMRLKDVMAFPRNTTIALVCLWCRNRPSMQGNGHQREFCARGGCEQQSGQSCH